MSLRWKLSSTTVYNVCIIPVEALASHNLGGLDPYTLQAGLDEARAGT